MTKKNNNFRIIFFAAVCCVFALSIFSYNKINDLIESASSVNHTTQLTLELEKVISSLKTAEIAQRGYLLSHDEEFLKDLSRGLETYPRNIEAVRQLSLDNPDQQKSLVLIENLSLRREKYMLGLVEIDKSREVSADELLVSQEMMDSLRTEVNKMIARENGLLEDRSTVLDKQSKIAPTSIFILSFIALTILIYSFWKLNKSLLEAQRLEEESIQQAIENQISIDKLKSEKKFRDLVEYAPVAISVLRGSDFVVDIANAKQLEHWKKTKEEAMDRPIFSLLPEAKELGFEKLLSSVLTTGEPYRINELGTTVVQQGVENTFYVNFVCEPIFNDLEIEGLMVVTTEVTEQVTARKKIEENEQRFQAAIEAVEGVIWTNNSKGEMEGEQKGWGALTGQTYEEYQGFGWTNAVHPEDIQPTIDAWNRAVKQGRVFNFEHRLKSKDGIYNFYSIRAVPTFNSDGTVRQWVGVHTDITIQKKQQLILKESENRYRSLVDNIPMVTYILEPGPEASLSFVNQTWLDYTGLTYENALGTTWMEIFHPDDVQVALDHYVPQFEKREPFFIPAARVKRHDGAYRWHLFTGNPRYMPNGEFVGYHGVGYDIHNQKLAEDNLAYRTALLEAHSEASVDGILLVDTKGKIISYNQRFIEIWSMPQSILDAKDDEAALAFALSQLVHPEKFLDKVKYLYEHPNEISVDELETKDGKCIERNGYAVIGEDGTYFAWSWTFKDVTRQRKNEKALKEREERFRSLAQTLPQLVWVTDENGKQEFASSRWKEFTGIEPDGEKEWKAVVHPEDYETINATWATSLTTGNSFRSEVRLRSINGEYQWFSGLGEPVYNNENEIIKWVGAFTDIHEQKIKEEKKDEFISIASHEMKTPLTTAKAYLEMLELTLNEDNPDAILFAKKANHSVNRLTELISELLDVSKIRLGKLNYKITCFDFNELIIDTVESIQLTSPSHQLITTSSVIQKIYGDRDRLQQVVINLLTNAIKYSPNADEVFISVVEENDALKVSVRDKGIGIDEKSLNKIFEKYHRIEEQAVHFQGLGIGLFISYEIIQRHNGKMWAESKQGEGSTLFFSIPINHDLTI